MSFRIERDSLGERSLQSNHYYGIQTQRAVENFNISNTKSFDYPLLIESLANIKRASAIANRKIGALTNEKASAISQACSEIANGDYNNQFPVDIFQGGGGTSLNMNMNEVIANRANEIITGSKGYNQVHPNNDVNLGQSTNDVIPSAIHIASYFYIEKILEELATLENVLIEKSIEFESVVKVSRTCLQDAVPITLGQEFSGYASFIKRNISDMENVKTKCLSLTLGGTAAGTGLGTYPRFAEEAYEELSEITGLSFYQHENLFDGFQNGDIYIKLSSVLKELAAFMSKMSSDFRLLSSGPRSGLSEINLPPVQPGSSIMPGKVNPVMPEMMMQASFQVYGNDHVINVAVDRGELDLNVWEPIIIKNLFESFEIMTNAIRLFTDKCIQDIEANIEICDKNAHSSLALSTVIATLFNYDLASEIAKEAHNQNRTIKEIVLEKKLLSKEEADLFLNPLLLSDVKNSSEILSKFKHKEQ
ncbi:aspartate ammonia-lyase [Oceanobacillus oncorhynchi subsp. oncorhynchi]|uniref:aspartate ammonia-lyase n=1 Tax=Oceanobacillus oncorhynchi TaxID=545501 RepID=UPI0036287850